jgi:hypothetical protein
LGLLILKKICVSFLIIAAILCAGVFAQAGGPIGVEEDRVVAEIGGVRQVVGHLAFSDDPFFGFGQTYVFSPAGDSIAYVGVEKESFGLYVYQAGERFAVLLPSHGEITGRTFPVWSSEGDLVAYSVGNRIWVFDPGENDAWIVTEPEETFYEDIDPVFSDDGESIFFYRGTTFEFSFSGDLFSVGLDGTGLTWVDEPYPKYPPEYLGGPDDEDPYMYSSLVLVELKAALFAMDLENHDYERLLTHFPGWFVIMAFEISGDLGGPIDEHMVSNFLFNGAAMYTDYGNQIQTLDSIFRVIRYEVDFFDLEVYFTVELYDGREVVFYLMFDQDTLQFTGAFG